MERDWDAEWAEIVEEHRQAAAAFRRGRQQGHVSYGVSRRYADAFTRRTVFIAERMTADPAWPDPDAPPVPV